VPWTGYAAALIATPGEAIARAAPEGVATMYSPAFAPNPVIFVPIGTPTPEMVWPTNSSPVEAVAVKVLTTGGPALAITPVKLAFVTGTPENGDAVTVVGKPNIAGAPVNLIFLAPDHVKVNVIPDACTFMLGRASPPLPLGNRNVV